MHISYTASWHLDASVNYMHTAHLRRVMAEDLRREGLPTDAARTSEQADLWRKRAGGAYCAAMRTLEVNRARNQ